jgi:hypothetical protein
MLFPHDQRKMKVRHGEIRIKINRRAPRQALAQNALREEAA